MDARMTSDSILVMTVLGPSGMAGGLVASTWGYLGVRLTDALIDGLVATAMTHDEHPLPPAGYLEAPAARAVPWLATLRRLDRGGSTYVHEDAWRGAEPRTLEWFAAPSKIPSYSRSMIVAAVDIRAEDGREVRPAPPGAPVTDWRLAALRLEHAIRTGRNDVIAKLFESPVWQPPLSDLVEMVGRGRCAPIDVVPSLTRRPECLAPLCAARDSNVRALARSVVETLVAGPRSSSAPQTPPPTPPSVDGPGENGSSDHAWWSDEPKPDDFDA